jgi:hypothetical protein
MKKVLKLSIITFTSSSFLFIGGCRPKPGDFGLSCQRLSSCYANYSSQLKDPAVKSTVEAAQSSKDEARCTDAITQLSKAVGQECPF